MGIRSVNLQPESGDWATKWRRQPTWHRGTPRSLGCRRLTAGSQASVEVPHLLARSMG